MEKQRRCANCKETLGVIRLRTEKPEKGDFVWINDEAGNTVYVKIKWMKKVTKVHREETSLGRMVKGVTCKKCGTYHNVYHSPERKFILKV